VTGGDAAVRVVATGAGGLPTEPSLNGPLAYGSAFEVGGVGCEFEQLGDGLPAGSGLVGVDGGPAERVVVVGDGVGGPVGLDDPHGVGPSGAFGAGWGWAADGGQQVGDVITTHERGTVDCQFLERQGQSNACDLMSTHQPTQRNVSSFACVPRMESKEHEDGTAQHERDSDGSRHLRDGRGDALRMATASPPTGGRTTTLR
jgi:hypothetical protein